MIERDKKREREKKMKRVSLLPLFIMEERDGEERKDRESEREGAREGEYSRKERGKIQINKASE